MSRPNLLVSSCSPGCGTSRSGAVRRNPNRTLVEAIRLYRSAGYEEVEPFNDEPFAHHWFQKRLDQNGDRYRATRG